MANVHVLPLHGEIDISQKQWIERELGQIERFGPKAVAIVDLSDVRYLDTTFLNALVQVRKHLAKEQPDISICLVVPRSNLISRLFAITQLDRVFHIFDDISSAHRHAAAEKHPDRGAVPSQV